MRCGLGEVHPTAYSAGSVGGREVRALGGFTKLNPHLGIPCSWALKPPAVSPSMPLDLVMATVVNALHR